MADEKLSDLTGEVTSPGDTDRFYIVDGIGGTPAQKYLEWQSLKASTGIHDIASPMVIGGAITDGTNAGTFQVASLTGYLRATHAVDGALTAISKSAEDNIAIAAADTVYYIMLNYNSGTPTISLSVTNSYATGTDYRNIPIGQVMKDSSDNGHYISGGFDFQDGVRKLHARANLLRGIELASGSAIEYSGTNNFTMGAGVCFIGINRHSLSLYDSAATQFIPIYSDGGAGFTEGAARNTLDYAHYDDGSGTLAEVGTAKYSCHWVYRHIDDGDVFVRYGNISGPLGEAETEQEPTTPSHLSTFGVLIGCIVAPQAGGSFTTIQMVTDTIFAGTASSDHGNLSGLTDDDHPQYIKDSEFTAGGDVLVGTGPGTFQKKSGSVFRASVGAAASGANSDITSLTGLDAEGIPYTALAGVPEKVNPLAMSQGVVMTAAASGSNGIQVANCDDLNFGTGDFTLVWKGSLPDWAPSASQFLFDKYQNGSNDFFLLLRGSGGSLPLQLLIGVIVDGSYVINKTSGVALDLVNNSINTITVSVARGNNIKFFVNKLLLSEVSLTGDIGSCVNTGILYVSGLSTARTASTTQAVYTYNRALSSDDVIDLYNNGVAEADKNGSMTPVYESDFSAGVDDWDDYNNWDSQTVAGGYLLLTSSGDTQVCRRSVAALTANKKMRINYTAASVVGSPRFGYQTVSYEVAPLISITEGTVSVVVTIPPDARKPLSFLYFAATTDSDSLEIKDIVVSNVGVTLRLEPENIQLSPGQWLDAANNHHAKLPAEGTSLTRPKNTFEIRWTNTWAGTHEAQYIGGVNEAILPENAFIEKIIGTVSGATIEDIIIGDGSDDNRFVEITTGLAAGTTSFTIAEPTTDGTNYKLVVDPDANFTGSIVWTIMGFILEA